MAEPLCYSENLWFSSSRASHYEKSLRYFFFHASLTKISSLRATPLCYSENLRFSSSRASHYEKSLRYFFFHASLTKISSLRATPLCYSENLRFSSSRASPYEKSLRYFFFHASLTKIYLRLFSHSSLLSCTLYHVPPHFSTSFLLLCFFVMCFLFIYRVSDL